MDIQDNDALTEFCGLYALLDGGFSGGYTVGGNSVNPTQQDIIDGGPCTPPIPVPLSNCALIFGFGLIAFFIVIRTRRQRLV